MKMHTLSQMSDSRLNLAHRIRFHFLDNFLLTLILYLVNYIHTHWTQLKNYLKYQMHFVIILSSTRMQLGEDATGPKSIL